jgi:hypothetical protein
MPNTIITIEPSKKTDKKYTASVNGTKHIDFGAKGYEDYTTHKDKERSSSQRNLFPPKTTTPLQQREAVAGDLLGILEAEETSEAKEAEEVAIHGERSNLDQLRTSCECSSQLNCCQPLNLSNSETIRPIVMNTVTKSTTLDSNFNYDCDIVKTTF